MPLRLPSTSSSSLIWLLEITFAGKYYRFSTTPVNISKDDGSIISFKGGLDDPQFVETLSRFDHSIDQQVISVSLDFEVDIPLEVQKGHNLSGCKGVLSCVMVQDGTIEQTYEGRLIVLSGVTSLPQYGFPNQPKGVVDLSIEGSAAQDEGNIIPPGFTIQTGVTTSKTIHNGKPYPLVFGTPGTYKDPDGVTQYVPGSPGYSWLYIPSSQRTTRLLLAGHHVNANKVEVFNDKEERAVKDVVNGRDDLGNPVAYAVLTHSTSFDLTSQEYWVNWRPKDSSGDYGGGVKNPWSTSEELTGAGDVIRYILQFSTLDIDHGAFAAVSDFLNQFKLSGYISDFDTRAWDWVSTISEVLPMAIRNGPKGLYPIIHDVTATSSYGLSVSASIEFQQIGPIQVETSTVEIHNSISIGYAFDAKENSASRYGVTGIKKSGDPSSFSTASTRASIALYGQRWRRIENAYVYERSTAQKIIKYISDIESLPARSVQYRASPRFAFLTLGDIVYLTDSNLGFTNQACFVSAKAWDVDSWVFTLTIDRIPDRDSYTS